jgi:hypothetical protein
MDVGLIRLEFLFFLTVASMVTLKGENEFFTLG